MIRLEEGAITAKAEVVRTQAQGRRLAHVDPVPHIEERDQDKVRRRVFQALREERARMADDASGDLRR